MSRSGGLKDWWDNDQDGGANDEGETDKEADDTGGAGTGSRGAVAAGAEGDRCASLSDHTHASGSSGSMLSAMSPFMLQ